jgi:hypothetical protein
MFKIGDIVIVWSKTVCDTIKQQPPAYGFVNQTHDDNWIIVQFFAECDTETRWVNILSDQISKVS